MNVERVDVAVCQLSSTDDVSANLTQVEAVLSEAAARGARLALLPENFAYFGAEHGRVAAAEALGDAHAPIQSALVAFARRYRLALVAGGFATRSDDGARPYNTALALDADGALVGAYHKIHLFDVDLEDGSSLRESAATAAGTEPVVVELAGLPVGLSVCYDLRFPELYRRLTGAGARALAVPAAFTLHTGRDHWHVLLRARAIENQAFVLAPAQWGKHPRGRVTYGHALIADPWGTVLAEAPDGVGVALARLELPRQDAIRRSLPCLAHRRL